MRVFQEGAYQGGFTLGYHTGFKLVSNWYPTGIQLGQDWHLVAALRCLVVVLHAAPLPGPLRGRGQSEVHNSHLAQVAAVCHFLPGGQSCGGLFVRVFTLLAVSFWFVS